MLLISEVGRGLLIAKEDAERPEKAARQTSRLGTWPLFTLARVLLPSDQRPLPSCPLFLEPQGSFPLAPPWRAPRINLCHSPSGSKAEISVLPAAACSASSPPDQILTLPLCGQKAQAKVCPDRKAAFFPSLPPKLTSGGSHLYLCRTACGTRLVPRRHHQQTLLPSLASLQRSHRLCQNASSCGLPADPWEQVGARPPAWTCCPRRACTARGQLWAAGSAPSQAGGQGLGATISLI